MASATSKRAKRASIRADGREFDRGERVAGMGSAPDAATLRLIRAADCHAHHRRRGERPAECLHDPAQEACMTRLYFHCASTDDLHLDSCGLEVQDLAEAREHALALARSVMAGSFGIDDFSEWLIYVGDEDDEQVLLVPFAATRPTLH
jgi:hypothetical protein